MITTALKHWIYEHCIAVLFDNISNNFTPNKTSLSNVKVGDRFEYILYPAARVGKVYFMHGRVTQLYEDHFSLNCQWIKTLHGRMVCNYICAVKIYYRRVIDYK